MMADYLSERRHTRHPEQFKVRFTPRQSREAFDGLATDLSAGGLRLSTPSSQPAGTRLEMRLDHPEYGFVVEGEVVYADSSTMGIRFLPVKELVAPLVLSDQVDSDSADAEKRAAELGIYDVQYSDQQELQLEYKRNLKVGGLVVPTPYAAAIGSDVEVGISVRSLPSQSVRLRGRVIAQFPSGIGVEITNLQTVREDLLRLAGLPE